MNWDRVQGDWKQFTGKVKEKWGKLTDDDLTVINGNRGPDSKEKSKRAMARPRIRRKRISTSG